MPDLISKPKFCVNEQFEGVIVVEMNSQFSKLLQEFIESTNRQVAVNSEIWAFRRALSDPVGSRDARNAKRRLKA